MRLHYTVLSVFSMLLVSSIAGAMTVSQIMEVYGQGDEGKTMARMYMAGVADGIVYSYGWDSIVAKATYGIDNFKGVCLPPKQKINADYLMDVLGGHITETDKTKGKAATMEIFKRDVAAVLIEILEEQNCPIRKAR